MRSKLPCFIGQANFLSLSFSPIDSGEEPKSPTTRPSCCFEFDVYTAAERRCDVYQGVEREA